jgi:hypothetical protein
MSIAPLWRKYWQKEGIRFLGASGSNAQPSHEDRFEHAFELGYHSGMMAQTKDFALPEGSHIAAIEWQTTQQEENE